MNISNESLRESKGKDKVVRLLYKFIDSKWFSDKKEKDYLVVSYNLENDKYIPEHHKFKRSIDPLYIWSDDAYNEIAGSPKIRNKKEQVIYARNKFKTKLIERFWFSNYIAAESKFIELSKKDCNNTEDKWVLGKTI